MYISTHVRVCECVSKCGAQAEAAAEEAHGTDDSLH